MTILIIDLACIAMAFDFVLLVAAGYQFLRQAARVSIWDLLFRDGLIFFIAASACNILPAVSLSYVLLLRCRPVPH